MSFDFLELAKQFGPFVAFTVYFVWQGWQREKRQTARIDELANQYNESLKTHLSQTTSALVNNTEVMRENVAVMEKMERLITRICAVYQGIDTDGERK